MKVFIYSAFISGVRSRAFHGLVVLTLLIMGLVWLSSGFSARHPYTLALDLGISSIRIMLIIMGIFWVQELFAKDVEQKTIIFALSYPVARSTYILGRFIGVCLLLFIALLIMGVILWMLINSVFFEYQQVTPINLGIGYIITLFYMWLSTVCIMAFSMFIASISTVPMLSFILGIGFAVGATLIGPTLDYLVKAEPDFYQNLGPIAEKLFWLLPDLSRLDIRDWALYGQIPESSVLVYGVVMVLAYSVLMLLLANLRFSTREFT